MRHLALKWRLISLTLGLVAAAVLAVLLVMLFEARTSQRDALLDTQRSIADVVAQNASAALAFQDAQAATKVLATLSANADMVGAVLQDSQGRMFARWARPGHVLDDLTQAGTTDHAFLDETIVVYRPVTVNGQRIGTLEVIADLERWYAAQQRQILLVALLLLTMLFIAGGFAWRLQSQITGPIDDLLATVNEITRRKDYSIRVQTTAGADFERLAQGLNSMLGEIQARDLSLQAAHAEQRAQVQRLDAEAAERQRAEQAVRDLNERLEVRVHERTRELENANAELESFASSVSHDLRAPVRAILGHLAALREDGGTTLTRAAEDRLGRVEAAATRMGRLIDALLNLAKISRMELRVREVDLSDLATRIADELQHAEPERKVECRVTPQLRAHGDPALLEVVMRNLLGNAWKFTRGRTVAHIEVGRYATPEGDVLFVRDDGAGFDMNYVSKLFGAFQRLHSPQEFEGTGIGLATVHRVVTRHGGRVWAEGQPDAGATMYFSLPPMDRAA